MITMSQKRHAFQKPHVASRILRVRLEADFDYASAEYAAFYADAITTAFQHPVWMAAFAKILAPARSAEMITLTLRDEHDELAAVLPMTLRKVNGTVLLEAADLGVIDYCAPVLAPNINAFEAGSLMAAKLPAHDVLRLRNIRPEHQAFFEAISDKPTKPAGFSAHHTNLAASLDAWKASALSASFAKGLERKLKKFRQTEGATVKRAASANEAASAISVLAHLRDGRFEGDMIALPAVREFYEAVTLNGFETGFAHVDILKLKDETIGVLAGIRYNGRFHYLLIGCNYASHGNLSPGMVLYNHALNAEIAAGSSVFDFTIGDEPFKQDFGTTPTPIASIENGRTFLGRAALLMHDMRSRIKNREASNEA
jgi:CelD/BcsL family acetyltransferase involved in cellulose biosynthesis